MLFRSVYGATLHALTTARDRLRLASDWEPDRIVDYGSGTGSAAWASEAVWGPTTQAGQPREYVGLEGSRSMVELSSSLFAALPQVMGDGNGDGGARLVARAHQLPIPSSSSALAKLQITPASSLPRTGKRTLALCAFTLGDQGTKEKRKELVRAMWESGAEVLVVVDRGTPGGSRMVVEAREQLLMYGKRNERQEQLPEGVVGPARGSYVVAPVSATHRLLWLAMLMPGSRSSVLMTVPVRYTTRPAPIATSRNEVGPLRSRRPSLADVWPPAVRSPPFLRYTKHATTGEDDAKFSYVVIQRGTRPAPSTPFPLITDELVDGTLAVAALEADAPSEREHLPPASTPGDELQWPRVVAPPLKRSGHIILEVCAASGTPLVLCQSTPQY